MIDMDGVAARVRGLVAEDGRAWLPFALDGHYVESAAADLRALVTGYESVVRERDAYKRAKAENDERFMLQGIELGIKADEVGWARKLAPRYTRLVEKSKIYRKQITGMQRTIDTQRKLAALQAAELRSQRMPPVLTPDQSLAGEALDVWLPLLGIVVGVGVGVTSDLGWLRVGGMFLMLASVTRVVLVYDDLLKRAY